LSNQELQRYSDEKDTILEFSSSGSEVVNQPALEDTLSKEQPGSTPEKRMTDLTDCEEAFFRAWRLFKKHPEGLKNIMPQDQTVFFRPSMVPLKSSLHLWFSSRQKNTIQINNTLNKNPDPADNFK